MLTDGEISSAEFMMMVFSDVEIHGTEIASEYNLEANVEGNPQVVYLLGIAQKLISDDDGQRVVRLLQQKKEKEGLELLLNSVPWVKTRFDALTDASDPTSVEEVVEGIEEIKEKAEELDIQVERESRIQMEQLLSFYSTASNRSTTMTARILELSRQSDGDPIAMIIGAAHTPQQSWHSYGTQTRRSRCCACEI